MKGLVEKLWDNTDRKGRRYLVLEIGGERYSLWDEQQMDGLQDGLVVDYEWKQSGNFRNITEIEPEKQYSASARAKKRDRDIVRMSCLKSAASLLSASELEPNEKGNLTLELAHRFERYITTDGDTSG